MGCFSGPTPLGGWTSPGPGLHVRPQKFCRKFNVGLDKPRVAGPVLAMASALTSGFLGHDVPGAVFLGVPVLSVARTLILAVRLRGAPPPGQWFCTPLPAVFSTIARVGLEIQRGK